MVGRELVEILLGGTVTCPITFDSENMVNYTLTATEAEWANTYGFTDIAEYYAANFAQA